MAYVSTPENLEIVEALAKAFSALPAGQVLKNKQIENLARGKRHLVAKARLMVQREQGCAFATVIGVGTKKLDPGNVHTVGQNARRRASNTITKAKTVLVGTMRTPAYHELDADTRRKSTAELAKLGIIAEFCQDD